MERAQTLGGQLARVGFACSVAGMILTPFLGGHGRLRWVLLAAIVAGLVLSLLAVGLTVRTRRDYGDSFAALLASALGLALWIWLAGDAPASPT